MKHPFRSKRLLAAGFMVTASALPAADETYPQGLSALELMAGLKTLEINDIEAQAAATVPALIPPETTPLPPPKLADASQVVSEKVMRDQGRTITVQRLFKAPPVTKVAPPVAIAKTEVAEDSKEPSKPHHTLFLSLTVYDNALTRLRWFEEGREFQVFVNFDFTLLRGLGRIETQRADYSLVLGIGEESLLDEVQNSKAPASSLLTASSRLPDLTQFSLERVSILPAKGNPPGIEKTAEFQALPDLLAHLQNHEPEIRWNQAVQKAENAARQRWLEANPPKPQNVVIQFWPVKNPVLPPQGR